MTTETPTREELDAHFDRFGRDVDYLNSIWAQVKRDYPDQYVAVYDGEIVANHRTLKKVLGTLKTKGFLPNYTLVRFAAKKPRKLIL
ncbi:MAG: DUF5678 domain-containing protein [Chloroflexi bacterium]|nr:DUF5678 domain-containing protein [Chloroflexota bacterium]